MKTPTRSRSAASVYSIYIVLALVNLATVAFVVVWSSRVSRDYRIALQENQRSSEQLAGLMDLRAAARHANAATAHVFATGDAERQRRKLQAAVAEADAAMARCQLAPADEASMRSAMTEMVDIAETILRLAPHDEKAAEAQLPRLHAALANVMTRAEKVSALVRANQIAERAQERKAHETMIRNRAILSLLVVMFGVAVTVHGFRGVRELGTAREREQYIAALQQQQQLLREREELLMEAEQLGTIGDYTWDIVHDTVYWSDELCRILGVPPGTSDVNYEKYLSRVHREDRPAIEMAIANAVANPGPFRFEHRWIRPNGETCLIRVKGKVEVDAHGAPSRMVGLVQDITQQRATLEQLRRHEEQLAAAQRIAHVGSWHWAALTDESTWSDELYRILGTDQATTPPSFESYLAFVHPEDRWLVMAWREKSDAERSATVEEHRLLRADGSVVIVNLRTDFSYGPSGELLQVVGTVQDVTERKRIEESLRISEERFALAAKATNEVIWDWDPATNLLWCNDAFAERYGHAPAASNVYDASAWLDCIHPDERESVWRSFRNAIANGSQLWSAEYQIINAAGEWRDVLDRGYLQRDADGRVVRVIGASLDITQRQREAEELARLNQQNKLVLNSTADGIYGMDRAGRINLVNAAGARMFGYSVEEMIGKHAHELLHHTRENGARYPVEECPIVATLTDGKRQRFTDVFWRKDGTSVPIEWSSNPMIDNNGAIVGVVVTCTDITERLKIDRMKDEFVSTVSHELRTPLTAIRGALGLLSAGRVGTFPEKAQRLLEIASTNTDRLVRLINDILDLEKIDSGKLTLARRSVAVDDIIDQAIDGVRPLLDRAKITALVQSATDVIHVDPDRMIQTLTNLLSNAIKFSPAGSTIRVSAQRNGSDIVIGVADEGRGIPSDRLEAIFERFEQVDASDARDKGGSGLGLAICRSIVRQHGGTIHAESELGRGSKFVFTIPSPVGDASVRVAPRKVLICDGDDAARASMRKVLGQSGFEVHETARAEDFVSALREHVPDVVLLDLCVPETNGFELLAQVRNDPRTADVPVVLMSVFRPEQLDAACSWLPKPLAEETLLATLKRTFDSRPRPRVLMVEDDIDLARVIAALFEPYDIDILHAATGKDAIAVARDMHPDLLILDLLLPDIDGFAVVQSLRTDDCCRNVPLLVYSALETSPEQQESLRLGRTEFLTKSRVIPEELERRVASLLGSILEREPGEMTDAA